MGFIRINRKLFENSFWKEERIYSRAEAWIDLIQMMSFTENNKKLIDGVMISWGRGQYPISHSFLSKRWNWSIHKVRIFITLLKDGQQVATSTAWKTTILTLCKYDFYNPKSQADVQPEVQAEGRQAAGSIINKEDKELNEEKEKEKEFFSDLKSEEEEGVRKIDFSEAPKNSDRDLSFLERC